MADLYPNNSADKAVLIMTELIRSGRFSNATHDISRMTKELTVIKAALEALHKD